ncbi:Sialic acid TRAP transporter permease protein SiaT [bioreactor metagenome]|uniref:Sialic acid TRAP transporter permease protein SiaT n=1 Tax=bioreactor metagenome TaxID=1076179 RepID=A0A645BPL0_9ZZZZ
MWQILNKAEKYIGGVLFFIIVILGFLQVLFRYVFQSPLAWTEEYTLFLFVWFVYLGSSACTQEKRHVCVEMFVERLPKKLLLLVNLFVSVCWLLFCVIIFMTSFRVAALAAERHSITIASKLPYVIAMSAVPVGMVLMGLRVIQNTVKLFRKTDLEKGREGTE